MQLSKGASGRLKYFSIHLSKYSLSSSISLFSKIPFLFITALPYVYKGANLSIWVVATDGSFYKMLGQLTTSDISQVSYDGTESDGRIRIKSVSDIFYLAPDGSNLTE